MQKNSCFSVERHIAEIHESEALVADYLNIGYFTNHSTRYLVSCVEGSAIEGCETKYCVMLWDKYEAKYLGDTHVNTTCEIKSVAGKMVKAHCAQVSKWHTL